MLDEGGMAINSKITQHLLNRILEFNEWGQCCVLELVSKYKVPQQEEKFAIMNLLEQCLRVSKSAVVLVSGVVHAFMHTPLI
jgi:AP-4 complex subunit beta-1